MSVTVCRNFDVGISIKDLTVPMGAFSFSVAWDPTYMECVAHDFHEHGGWTVTHEDVFDDHIMILAEGEAWTEDESWATFTFHCLAEGTSYITVEGWVEPVQQLKVFLDPVEGTVNQVEPAPVGGIVMPISKLEVLAPYVALAGLIAAVTIVIVKIRSRKPE